MKGFVQIPNELYTADLSIGAKAVWGYLASMSKDWNFYQDRMCEDLRISKPTLRRFLKELEDKGWLFTMNRNGSKKEYFVCRTWKNSFQGEEKILPGTGKKSFPITILKQEQTQQAHASVREGGEYSYETFIKEYGKAPSSEAWCRKLFDSLTDEEIDAVRKHLPKYTEATPELRFRKCPDNYLKEKTYNQNIIRYGNSKPVFEPQYTGTVDYSKTAEDFAREDRERREEIRRSFEHRVFNSPSLARIAESIKHIKPV